MHHHTIRGDYAVAVYLILVLPLVHLVGTAKDIPFRQSCFEVLFGSLEYAATACFAAALYRISPWHPLAGYPGPWMWRISSLYLAYVSFFGKRHLILDDLHKRYGAFVRIGM